MAIIEMELSKQDEMLAEKEMLVLDQSPIISKHDREMLKECDEREQHRLERSNQELATGTVSLINLCLENDIDTVFFLDKSARPLGYLFAHTWQNAYPNRPHPEIKFINIGRESDDWDRQDVQKRVHAVFGDSVEHKNVCIVDDHKDTGVTLVRAKKLFEQTFPDNKSLIFRYALQDQPDWSIAEYKHTTGVKDMKVENEKNAFGYLTEPIDFDTSGYTQNDRETFIELRHQLASLAKEIAAHVTHVSKEKVSTITDTPDLDTKRLNKWKLLGFDPKDLDKLRT